ncbi:class I SAM-dependent methyltransferase [Geomesophilobacter sediminis]|uniref:Class I SAM-dependent methyltransferase n=1 Tax=Geomesophilobacter sediminis TaxID=2798584 RepID=A0A8J7LV04_9BACT|nr:class I SAM-dependent methyltransferase [Geomesophilobacter sediminis]MBJ6724375.1 class I SAM-dependent methyltransferase [Geomesophilobacter sediminis]
MTKRTVQQIKDRFNSDVERFSDLDKGQEAAVDSTVALGLVASAALAVNPKAQSLLDLGCGAGNWTVKLLQQRPGLDVTLVDLAPAMLKRAQERALAAGAASVTVLESDLREVNLDRAFDIVVASAVLHHLRDDPDWHRVFSKIFQLVAPGGSFWMFDLVDHEIPEVAQLMLASHGRHLESIGGKEYRDGIFGIIEREDTPRPVTYQLDLLREVGFTRVDLLHKNSRFAVFGAVKGRG